MADLAKQVNPLERVYPPAPFFKGGLHLWNVSLGTFENPQNLENLQNPVC